jgi:hypothetical protein
VTLRRANRFAFFPRQIYGRITKKNSKSEVDQLFLQKQSILTDNTISINKIINLQNELDKKAALISPVFLGPLMA